MTKAQEFSRRIEKNKKTVSEKMENVDIMVWYAKEYREGKQ